MLAADTALHMGHLTVQALEDCGSFVNWSLQVLKRHVIGKSHKPLMRD